MTQIATIQQKLQELFPEFKNYKQLELELYKEDRSQIVEKLLSVAELKAHFFYETAGILVFDCQKLSDFLRQKEVFASSYTKYKNKITLMAGEKSIATGLGAVVLNFPFKECILEGGMSTEDKKRSEIFYNQTLAPEEITRLSEPKVLTNFTRISAKTLNNPPPRFYFLGGSQSQLVGDAGRGANNILNNIEDKNEANETARSSNPPLEGGSKLLAISGRGYKTANLKFAKEMRKEMTKQEFKLWNILKSNQLGFKFRRQHPVGDFITDFCCLEKKLVIELDGGQHIEQEDYDKQRTAFLNSCGFKVIRFWNNEFMKNIDGCAEFIIDCLNDKTPPQISAGDLTLPENKILGEGYLAQHYDSALSDEANETARSSNPPLDGGSQSQLVGDAGRGANNILNNIEDKNEANETARSSNPPLDGGSQSQLVGDAGRGNNLYHNSSPNFFENTPDPSPRQGEGWKTTNQDLKQKYPKFNHETDNMLIKGNNLLALYSLLPKYRGKVKLIYIDPPYNTGNDGFKYNDNFNHSTWLVFMKNRLEVAKDLLADDGFLMINCFSDDVHYLKCLIDEIFSISNFCNDIILPFYDSRSVSDKYLPKKHSNVLLYRKSHKAKINHLKYTNGWGYSYLRDNLKRINKFKNLLTNDEINKLPRMDFDFENIFLNDFIPSQLIFIQRSPDKSQFFDLRLVENGRKQECIKNFNSRQNSEEILSILMEIATKPGDLILDFFAGSGTTPAVAHKMGRRWIAIEQMDYIETITKTRLKKVLDGEQGGVSKNQNWQGGGSFCYFELFEWNKKFADLIDRAENQDELTEVYEEIKEQAFWRYDFSITDKEFTALNLEEQKQLMVEMLNKNHLYCNIGEIADESYKILAEDLEFNKDFYENSFYE